jgi:hypothetical protein
VSAAPQAIQATLAGWSNLYLITGTAAATLTGLQFVVQTLLASGTLRSVGDGDPEGGTAAFGSPTVVHFSLALLLSAVLCAPWGEYGGLRLTLGVLGAGALVYSGVVLRRARRQRSYVPTTEELLLCVGIHNAWDTVTYLTATALRAVAPSEGEPAPPHGEDQAT